MTTKTTKQFRGMIRLYIGPMFSNKTGSLLEAYTRHSIGSRRCLLVRHASDSRYSTNAVSTHDGRSVETPVSCQCLYEIDHLVNNYQVICIDEIQFFEDAPIFCDKWANQGLIVEACGLCGTYTRTEFPVISKLIPLAEEVYKKSAICRETGRDAQFTLRTSNDEGTIVIGGADKYKPVDRKTFFTEFNTISVKEHELNEFKKFMEIYCSKNNVKILDYEKLWQFFNDNYTHFNCYPEVLKKFTTK